MSTYSYMSVDLMRKVGGFYSVHDADTGEIIDREFIEVDAVNGWAVVFKRDANGLPLRNKGEIEVEKIFGRFEIRRCPGT